MEIKVIGIGPGVQEHAEQAVEAIKKALGIKDDGDTTKDPILSAIERAVKENDLAQFRQAKKRIKKALTAMREDGIAIDNAGMALAEVTCIFFNGALKPVEGKTAKEAFMDFIGDVFDVAEEKVKEMRAKREEACRGR